MTEHDLIERTKRMALNTITLIRLFPKNDEGSILGKQLLRSATSIAANYRSACKARSLKDFINKLGIVEEEADETQLWLELIIESNILSSSKSKELLQEAKELTAIFAASRKTAQRNFSKL